MQYSQKLKLDLVKLYMDVKVRNKDEIVGFGEDQYQGECSELYELDTETIISYIKQSIEILLMMKDEEYGDVISQQTKKIQQLTTALTQKKSKTKQPEENFIDQIKQRLKNGMSYRSM